ncbi:MAG TPA: 5'-nucleotidase C-terminal domain-containing protein [Gemmatimonadales bacterium]|nr:5'-nucleotidase C-terminal domain-containing protein [Gemmatimonadales bacterium]
MIPLLTALTLVAGPLQDTAHVVVVATTDIHGHATDWDYLAGRPFPGGLARVATIVDSLRTRHPGQVVLVDAGDLIQGNPFATYFARVGPRDPNPVIEAMNLTGYDVATLGNHDFDWGLPLTRGAMADAAFPYVSGNIYTLPGDTLLLRPYAVVQRHGVRIGVAGFTTPGAMVWNRDQIRGKLRIDRIPKVAGRVLESLRRESDLAIVVTHSGMDGPSSYDTTGVGSEDAAAALAALPVRPDLVVVGHSHREMRDSVIRGVHFVQPRPYAGSVSVTHIDMVRQQRRWKPIRIRSDLVSTARVAPSERLAQRLAAAHGLVRTWVSMPVGQAMGAMRATAARAEPTPILELVNYVQRKRTGAELSAASAFDLQAGFDSGTIRLGQVIGLYPFDNTLRAVRISGVQLKQYLEHSARYFQTDAVGRVATNDSVPGYNFDQVSGARYDIDLRRPVGDRIQSLAVNGRPVAPENSYTLAVNSHRQTGAGGYTMLRGAPVVYDKGENIRDLLIEEIRARKTVDPADFDTGEWRIVPEGPAAAVRELFQVPRTLPVGARDTVLLRVLATTDLHGALLARPAREAGSRTGGISVAAGLMDSLESECDCPTLRFDAGDAMHGSVTSNVTRGRAMVEVLNRMRIAAAAPGDHDFEWSVDTLRRRMSESRYPWVVANLFDASTGKRPEWALPYTMLEAGGLRVAVVGYITPEIKSSIKPELTAGLRFSDGALAIHDVLAEVRAQRPDLTVVLAHAGGNCTGAVCTGEVIRLADAVESRTVDLIVAGHTHEIVNTKIAGVPIVQAGNEAGAIAVADVVKTPAGGREVRTRIELVSRQRAHPDPDVAALVEASTRRADSLINRVVANVKLPLARAGDQHRLGAMIAEARRNVLRTDIGLVSNDDIRSDLEAGPVTYGNLFEVQPSQNRVVRVTVSGAQLRDVVEHALQRGRPAAHIAGAKVRYDPRRRPGSRVRSVELQRRKLRPEARYTLAVDDFLATGGGGYNMLVGLPQEAGAILDVDAVIAYLRRLPQPVNVTALPGFISTRR